MNTEITDIRNENGWVCFDADCGLCVSLARRFRRLLGRYGFCLVPLQTPWVRDRLETTGEELLSEMRLIRPEGRVHGGADALAEIAATFVFDLRPYLTNFPRRIGYHAINLVFVYLPVIYLLAAWKGAKP